MRKNSPGYRCGSLRNSSSITKLSVSSLLRFPFIVRLVVDKDDVGYVICVIFGPCDRQRETGKERHRHRGERERDRERQGKRDTDIGGKRDRQRGGETETDKERDSERETDKEREGKRVRQRGDRERGKRD